MATSSITKDFIVRDAQAFDKLYKKVQAMPERKVTKSPDSSCLIRGKAKLKQFSFR